MRLSASRSPRVGLCLLLIVVWAVFAPLAGHSQDLRLQKPGADFLIVGHMGAPLHAVENTLPSFQKALELGANAIETDVCITKDGEVVLWHDWSPHATVSLFRQLGKQGLKARPFNPDLGSAFRRPVNELTLAELRQHFGYALRQTRIGENKRLPDRIVTIREFAQWAANRDDLVKVLFDIKVPAKNSAWVRPLMKRICSVLNQYNLLDRAAFMSPEPAILDVIADMNDLPEITVVHDQELPPASSFIRRSFPPFRKRSTAIFPVLRSDDRWRHCSGIPPIARFFSMT
ncbi:MAG TPA: glycerophosphodiester phosphodiesterase family protein [Candidatus Ozemobacteraceae bacterium]|nr:glycerophosphodiester phosphodiesterase family protein [Candidatus Ozemobacteraceae bacterium]